MMLKRLHGFALFLTLTGVFLSAAPRAHAHGDVVFRPVSNGQDRGPGSLRSALAFANDSEGVRIIFQIPTTDSSYDANTGIFTIALETPLPPVEKAKTMLDGLAQTRAFDSNKRGPEVLISGHKLPTGTSGLTLRAPGCEVKGLILANFPGHALVINSDKAIECRVQSNVIENNRGAGIVISYGATSNYIGLAPSVPRGGPFTGYYDDAKAGNIIQENGAEGVRIVGEDTQGNSVRGNFILGNAGGTITAPVLEADAGDAANGGLTPPRVLSVKRAAQSPGKVETEIVVAVTGKPNQVVTLDVYWEAATPGALRAGPGSYQTREVKLDSAGKLETTLLIAGYPAGDVYATVTALDGSTSAAGPSVKVPWLF